MMGLVLLTMGCGDPIGPSESCSGQPANTSVKFEDANLEAEIREGFEIFGEIGPGDDLTCGLLSGIEGFIGSSNIRSLVGIQNLTSLTFLSLPNNSFTDISPLSGLTSLETLFLGMNSITDISALSGLTSLRWLTLWYNSITDISALSGLTKLGGPSRALTLGNNPNLTDIQPLLDNTGLGARARVRLIGTSVTCVDVAALEAKGVRVDSECP